jgi:hypothetical protein
MPDQSTTSHGLHHCALCGGTIVDRNEKSEVCGNCRTRAPQNADERRGELAGVEMAGVEMAGVGGTTSGDSHGSIPSRIDVPGESSRPEWPAKTNWKSPPFQVQFAVTAEPASSDSVPTQSPPTLIARTRNKVVLATLAVLLVYVILLISRYGVPEILH